jgi:hypothetical protein
MLLLELAVKDTHYANQKNIAQYIAMYGHRARAGERVRTSDANLKLDVWKSDGDRLFTVFPVVKEDGDEFIAGFVEFTWPEKLGQRRSWAKNVRTPHSGLLQQYQGRGIVKMIYKWFLDSGHIMVTGDLQTPSSNALWKSLANQYEVVFFDEKGEFIDNPTPAQAQKKNVRMAMLGKGQTREDLFK